MPNLQRRIEQLEQQADPERTTIVVNWAESPESPGPGVRVVRWEDVDGKGDEDESDAAEGAD